MAWCSAMEFLAFGEGHDQAGHEKEIADARCFFPRLDYWESGMDLYPGHDMYDSFCRYQAALLAEFDSLSKECKFETIDASADADVVCDHLKKRILEVLEPTPARAFVPDAHSDLLETFTKKVRKPHPHVKRGRNACSERYRSVPERALNACFGLKRPQRISTSALPEAVSRPAESYVKIHIASGRSMSRSITNRKT